MEIQVKRPVIWVATAYITGILFSSFLKWTGWIVWTAAVLCLLITVLWLKKGKVYIGLALLLAFMWTGIVNASIARTDFSGLEAFEGSTLTLTGQILDVLKHDSNRAVYVFNAEQVEYKDRPYSVKGRVRLSVYFREGSKSDREFNIGEMVEIRGELKKPQGARNPKGFNYRAYLERQGIFHIINVPDNQIKVIGNRSFDWPYSWIARTRGWMQNIIERNLEESAAGLVKSMIIGDRSTFSEEISSEFSETGLAHILSISGLHVGYIALMLSFLQKILKLPSKTAFIIQTVLLCFYCLLCGASASAVRATIMAVILMGGKLLGRKPDPINSLALAALVILIFRPLDLFDVGFQLSFAAVAGIFLYADHINKAFKFLPHFLSGSASVTLSAQLGVWPLIAYYSNIFSPLALATNLLMVPISGIIVMLGFIMILVAGILPWFGNLIWEIIELACRILIEGNSMMAAVSWSSIKVVSPNIVFLLIYYLILWIMSDERPAFIQKPWMWSGGAAIIILAFMLIKSLLPTPMEIIFLDVGQGDCIYIRTPEKKHILVDGGGRSGESEDFDVGEDVVVPFLLKNGVRHLDLVIMSHAHDDHIGGLIPVIRDLKVDAFMEFPPKDISKNYQYMKELVEEKGITHISAAGGERYRIGNDVWLDVLYPVKQEDLVDGIGGDNENNRSLVIRLQYQGASVLFTGDIEREVEKYLSDAYDIKADILKVAHHGSRTSSIEEWIEDLQPKIAVIQVGNNMFGHPHQEVEERLDRHGAKVYRNDKSGAVICSYKGDKWQVTTMLQE